MSYDLGAYAAGDGVRYLRLERGGPVAELLPRSDVPYPARAMERPIYGWDEREMADERGVTFANSPDARPFREHGGRMPAAVVASGAGLTQIVVGPVHAGIIEPGRFTFSSGGETVIHLDAQLGFAYRGVERFLEGRDALAAAPAVARICGSCSAARSHAYALALEHLAGIELPEAVAFARVALCEMERIYNHLGDLAACASAAGWAPGYSGGLALKERAMRLNALASGHRLLFDAIRPGGIAPGVLADPARVASELAALEREVDALVTRLFQNGSLVSRWHRAGVVSREAAAAFGATGPALRGSGGELDVRTFAPYGAYAELDVNVTHERAGDAFARCSVKRDELTEAFRLTRAALAKASPLGAATGTTTQLLGGEPAAERATPADRTSREATPNGPLPIRAGIASACVEGPRGAETVVVHVDEAGRIERFHAISASYRNWPLVARAMDDNIVPDFPIVNKSFNLCYACADR